MGMAQLVLKTEVLVSYFEKKGQNEKDAAAL